MLKEKVTHCEILDTRIRRMSCRMKILPTKSNIFSRKVAEQYDRKISSYITTEITEQLSLS